MIVFFAFKADSKVKLAQSCQSVSRMRLLRMVRPRGPRLRAEMAWGDREGTFVHGGHSQNTQQYKYCRTLYHKYPEAKASDCTAHSHTGSSVICRDSATFCPGEGGNSPVL